VSNGPEILPYLLYILLPVPLALNVIQILSIDLGTDIIPSMALGQEPPDPEIMHKPPRLREQGLLTLPLILHSYLFLGLLEGLWSLGLFFYVLTSGGWHFGEELATNDPLYHSAMGIALSTILLMQIGNLLGRRFSRRSGLDLGIFKNRLMLLGIAIQVVFSWATLYFPPLQKILNTGPVPLSIYFLAWFGIILIFGSDYLRKRYLENRERSTCGGQHKEGL
ncbi:MAG: cation transporting ATPase C-terminal domain-containing protein, partial [Bacteroidetes bacterium]|nr:cation transporting ATPase C-terminal domain-containing protein [Bacteroidota bacterium]